VKLERLIAIIMMLLNKDQVNAKELAAIFEVSKRTIYRDIDTINQAGIPIVSFMGAEGGFGILDTYKINKNFFDELELGTLIQTLKNLNNTVHNSKYTLTLEKLETLQSKTSKAQPLQIPVNIDFTSWNSNNTDKEKVKFLTASINDKKVLTFDYINGNGEYTHRRIEPLSLLLKDFSWYLHGYCLDKDDFRLFKLKRMRNVKSTNTSFSRSAVPVEALDYLPDWYQSSEVIDIVLEFDAPVLAKIVDSFNEEQIQLRADHSGTVHFTAPFNNWLFELILGFGYFVKVLSPVLLQEEIRQQAGKLLSLYETEEN